MGITQTTQVANASQYHYVLNFLHSTGNAVEPVHSWNCLHKNLKSNNILIQLQDLIALKEKPLIYKGFDKPQILTLR